MVTGKVERALSRGGSLPGADPLFLAGDAEADGTVGGAADDAAQPQAQGAGQRDERECGIGTTRRIGAMSANSHGDLLRVGCG
jgi:hypothetical protein